MPFPGRTGRVGKRGRGPYKKSGLLRETLLAPLATVYETFEITHPFEDKNKNGTSRRELIEDGLIVSVALWYLVLGDFDGNLVAFFEEEKTLDLKTAWIWR